MDKVTLGGIAAENEIVFAEKREKVSAPLGERSVVTELLDDFTLPDYRPEIRRLLRISVSLPAPSAYVSQGSAEFSGDACYSVLYVGGDGKLCSADLTAVYEAQAEIPACESVQNVISADEIEAENLVGRVIAPRKLSIRCRLRHRIRFTGERMTDVSMEDAPESDKIKRLCDSLPTAEIAVANDDSYEIEESVPIPESARIICSEATPFINEARVRDGGAAVRGMLGLKITYDTDSADEPTVAERKIPFEALLPIGAEGDGWECRAYGCAHSVSTELSDGGCTARIGLSLCAEAQRNRVAKITRDVYATDRPCDLKCEEISVPIGLYCGNGNFTLSGSAELSGIPEGARIIASFAKAEPGELSDEAGKYVLTGKCRFSAVVFGEGEYSSREFELPFKYEFGNAEVSADDYSADLSCHNVRIRADKNTLSADTEICAAVRVFKEKREAVAIEASFGEPLDIGALPAYTVVYVTEGESLWSLAKKYSADPVEIAKANGLKCIAPASESSLAGVDFLII